jgi:hypothetical protein
MMNEKIKTSPLCVAVCQRFGAFGDCLDYTGRKRRFHAAGLPVPLGCDFLISCEIPSPKRRCQPYLGSFKAVLIAFAFAVVIGIALGVGLGWSARFNAVFGCCLK